MKQEKGFNRRQMLAAAGAAGLTALGAGEAQAQAKKKKSKKTKGVQWLPFKGKVTDKGKTLLLEADNGNGAIEVDKNDVRASGNYHEVRVGTKVKLVKQPAGKSPAGLRVSDCPSGKTYCIMPLMFCCENDVLIGGCIGFWYDCD